MALNTKHIITAETIRKLIDKSTDTKIVSNCFDN